jgi:hypothetical protein
MGHSQPLFKRAVIRCFEKNKVFEGSANFPNFSQVFDEIDGAAKNLKLDGYEHRNVRDHLKFVLYSFIETGDILDCKRGLTVQDFFAQEDIILNVMEESSDSVVSTIVTDIFCDLRRFYEKHPVDPPVLRCLIFADECRKIFPLGDSKNQFNHNPNSQMISFVTSRRSSGIGIAAITQEPQSSPAWLTDNSAFVLGFPIGGEAREHEKQLLNLTEEQSSFIDELPKYGTGIFRDRRFNRRYLIQIPGDLKIEPITTDETATMMHPFTSTFHAIGKPGADEAPEAIDLDQMEQQLNNQKIGVLILRKLKEKPFLQHTQLVTLFKEEYGFSRSSVDSALDWLRSQEFITTLKARASKTREATHFPMMVKAQVALGIPELQCIAASRFKHTLYCKRIQKFLKSEGYDEAILEYSEGEPEVTIRTESGKEVRLLKRIDLLVIKDGKRIAYEVTLSLSNLIANVYKCLELFKIDELHIVCERQDQTMDRAMKLVSEKVPGYLLEKITWDTMTNFF